MMRLLRHIPAMMLCAMLLSFVACGSDEPEPKRPGEAGGSTTPADSTNHPADTTGNHPGDSTGNGGSDTTITFSIQLQAPSDYAYMGQSLQLTAVTSTSAQITWKSSNTNLLVVDNNGLVRFGDNGSDGDGTITASANGVSSSILLHNRHWNTAVLNQGQWTIPTGSHIVRQGDTLTVSIVDSALHPVNDNNLNAKACNWAVSCPVAATSAIIDTSFVWADGTRLSYVIATSAPAYTDFSVIAGYGQVASEIMCTILPKNN